MRLKSYFAATVEAALGIARQELGADAMLVDSRRTSADTRHLGEYEVIIAAAYARPKPLNGPPEPQGGSHSFGAASLDKLSEEVGEMKRYMERMAHVISSANSSLTAFRLRPDLAELFARLAAAGVDSNIANELLMKISESSQSISDAEQALLARLSLLLAADPSLGRPAASRKIAALAGPPGSGKTATLVKLAARFGLVSRRPAQIITLDTYRVAASEQLRSYAAILGIAFQICETPGGLAQALEEHRNKDLILIDTPGFAPAEMDDAQPIAHVLARHPEIDTHLVVPATAKSNDLKAWAKAYERFRPSKLLFTRLDETTTFGPLLNLCVESAKPVSFLAFGQQIPEHLKPASPGAIAQLIIGSSHNDEIRRAAVAAA